MFVLALCAFLIAQPFIRDRGGAVFWAFVAMAIVYASVTLRPILVRPLLGFTLVGIAYIALSYVDAFPDAWTRLFDSSYIPRQAFYVVLLYPLTLAAYSMWSRARATSSTGRVYLWLFVAAGAIFPLVAVYAGAESGVLAAYASVTTGGLGNARLLFFMALTYFLLVHVRNVEMARVYTLFLIAAFFASYFVLVREPQIQNMIALGVFLLLAFSAAPRRLAITLVMVGIAAYLALIPFASSVYDLDKNTGYRLILTQDALRGVTQSYMIGVGFGKEVATDDYNAYGVPQSGVDSASELAARGIHNSLAQELMRLGIVGGAFVIWLFVVTCAPPRYGPIRVRRHLAVTYVVLLLGVMANVALESPTYLVGVSCAVGYLLVGTGRFPNESRSSEAEWPA
jgi:hypothetical protein